MHDPGKTGRGFDRLARIYDRCVHLFLGARLIAIQQDILQELPARATCLIIGGGTGAVLKAALRQELAGTFVYAELSAEMIARTCERLTPAEREKVQFTHDWRSFTCGQTFDYIILPFVLDCYNESTISGWLDEFSKISSPGARLIVADFNSETDFGYRPNLLHGIFIKVLYLFFRLTTSIEAHRLPRIAAVLRSRGYECRKVIYRNRGWIQASQWSRNTAEVITA